MVGGGSLERMKTDAETMVSVFWCRMDSQETVWDEVEKNSFIALPGEWGHRSGPLPLKTVKTNTNSFLNTRALAPASFF